MAKFNTDIANETTFGPDLINTPPHYHKGGIDVIGFAEKQFDTKELIGSHRINVLKYVTRFDKKGAPLMDLQKARVYLDKLIEIVEREG